MTTHDLKIWPEPFAAVLSGAKTYESRRDNRGFAVGDRLRLREWLPANADETSALANALAWMPAAGYTGRVLIVEVTYKTSGGAWGLPDGLCVLAIRKVGP